MTTDRSTDPTADRSALRADCANCAALCCTAFGFQRSADFPVDKPAGTPCRNLTAGFSCSVHDSLRPRGFRGCTVFDCFGAGQYVSQELFGGRNWRDHPEVRSGMFRAFAVARQLHELLWYLAEARTRAVGPETAAQAAALEQQVRAVLDGDVDGLLDHDVQRTHAAVRDTLVEVSAEVRGGFLADDVADQAGLRPGADLAGRDLRSLRLIGADLRGASLIAADLRGTDLASADLLGADLRDARLDGADLSSALFVSQPQVDAARGDHDTRLPADLRRPGHWEGTTGGRACPSLC
ncbi:MULTISPECIES: pentapeptide repeat-containing protein [unclassified Curtobacterium]|uniref:pentapeptide repeat-containing protein n=1 Tax=unclassified Curtobacterium TaxID=257496 RepID=UPI0008DD53A9|nr:MULTISPECIES: pentapeptide repeat-containing protein [unclassified Curtobacterium]OIH94227.1 hypothetical protein BIU92_07320 [Curtobacterium sp. MCBA15_003]OII29278.1 hypothetical protein BIU94_12680 [Curtobacterium sp. MMLR14_006]